MLAADYIVVAAAADGCRYKWGHVASPIGFVVFDVFQIDMRHMLRHRFWRRRHWCSGRPFAGSATSAGSQNTPDCPLSHRDLTRCHVRLSARSNAHWSTGRGAAQSSDTGTETWGSSDRGSKLNSSPADRVAAVAAAGIGHIAAADAIARQARWKNALWVRAWSRLGPMLAGVAMPVQRPTMAIDQQVHLSAGTGICTPKSGRWGSAAKCLLYAASRAMFPNPLGAASAPLKGARS